MSQTLVVQTIEYPQQAYCGVKRINLADKLGKLYKIISGETYFWARITNTIFTIVHVFSFAFIYNQRHIYFVLIMLKHIFLFIANTSDQKRVKRFIKMKVVELILHTFFQEQTITGLNWFFCTTVQITMYLRFLKIINILFLFVFLGIDW